MSGDVIAVSYTAKDFLEGVHLLDAWEELAYRRICDLIYYTRDQLPNDDRKLAVATKTGRRWKRVKAALLASEKIFVTDDGKVSNKRCRRELRKICRGLSASRNAQTKSGIIPDNPLKTLDPDFSTRAGARNLSLTSTELPGEEEPEANASGRGARGAPAQPQERRNGGSSGKTRLPADWMPNLEDCQYAAARGFDDRGISEQAEAFRDWHVAKGDLCASWSASWRTWIRRANDFRPRVNGAGHAARPGSVTTAVDNLLSRLDVD